MTTTTRTATLTSAHEAALTIRKRATARFNSAPTEANRARMAHAIEIEEALWALLPR